MKTEIVSRYVEVDGLRLHYREGGSGDPVLLLHGWPTSSFLWRNIVGRMAEATRPIALDLPGFGFSDKPLDASYSFRFFERILNGFFDKLGIDEVGMAVHDLGGPVGLYWACQNLGRIEKLAVLNTLVYPVPSWAVVLFLAACRLPGVRGWLTSPSGLKLAMRIGVRDPARRTDEMIRGVQAPFATAESRQALLKAALGLNPKGMAEIARRLPSLQAPVRIIYGEEDRILPDVARTMRRLAKDLPQAEMISLPGCGHFLQEDQPEKVAALLAEFFAPVSGERAESEPIVGLEGKNTWR